MSKRTKRAPQPVVATRIRAAETPNSADIPENDRYWRRVTGARNRNLMELDHRKMVEESSKAARDEGLPRAHVRLMTALTVGANEADPTVECQNAEARKRLNELLLQFWTYPRNDLRGSLGEFMSGLTTTGSLCLPVRTGVTSRVTQVGYIDPAMFSAPYVITDPENAREGVAVLRSGDDAAVPVAHPIIRADGTLPELFAATSEGSPIKLRAGQTEIRARVGTPCFYAGINRSSPSQTVGVSDLWPTIDMAHALDELVFGAVSRSLNLGAYSLHVKFPKGTSETEINKRMERVREDLESGRGRAIGTTDDVSIQAVAAALQAGEWATMEKTARTTTLIALGPWPIHIFSEGAGTNVTAAAEQGSAIANILLDRQNVFRRVFVNLCTYAIRQYPEGKRLLDANPDAVVTLPLPQIVAKNTTRESNVLVVEMNALRQAEDNGYITLEAAQREAADALARYGFKIGPADIPAPTEVRTRRETSALQPQAFQVPDDMTDPDADPRGGHRDGETRKIPEGTPAEAAA